MKGSGQLRTGGFLGLTSKRVQEQSRKSWRSFRRSKAGCPNATTLEHDAERRRKVFVAFERAPVPKQSLSVARIGDLWQHQDGAGAAALDIFRGVAAPLTFAVSKCRAEPAKKTFEPGNYGENLMDINLQRISTRLDMRSESATNADERRRSAPQKGRPITNDLPDTPLMKQKPQCTGPQKSLQHCDIQHASWSCSSRSCRGSSSQQSSRVLPASAKSVSVGAC